MAKWKTDSSNLQRINEKTMNEHRLKIITNLETLNKHKESIDENRRHITASQDSISKLDMKGTKMKESVMSEIQISRDEIYIKIDQVDRYSIDGLDLAKSERVKD